jgi:hypothetical protein
LLEVQHCQALPAVSPTHPICADVAILHLQVEMLPLAHLPKHYYQLLLLLLRLLTFQLCMV